MELIYAKEPLDIVEGPVVFLAGPTPRRAEVESWRPAAVEVFDDLGFPGTLLLPEDRSGIYRGDYDDQVDWERAGLSLADVVMFPTFAGLAGLHHQRGVRGVPPLRQGCPRSAG